MSKSALAWAVGVITAAAAVYALAPTLVTIATNDPHLYQPLLRRSVLAAVVVMIGSLLFFILAPARTRVVAIGPMAIAAWVIYRSWQLWPYAFG